MIVFFILSFFITSQAHALNCDWWQTKYSAAVVDKHPRKQTTVREHPRKEYCRNKWKDADVHIKQFQDDPIIGWSHNGEVFKKWNRKEIQTVLELIPSLPGWTDSKRYSFRRAIKSIYEENPATSEVTYGSIVLYDLFFRQNDKAATLVHESAHHLYKRLGSGINEFVQLSGWTEEVTKDSKVFEVPPKKLIKPDSALNKEEDFANHIESFYSNPEVYKRDYPKIYEFFQKRYPL